MNKTEDKPSIIIVLGMHRSGTSLVAQLVAKWGAYMGDDLMPSNEYNKDGYWEYNPLVNLNDKMLAYTGNSWYAPPASVNVPLLVDVFGEEARNLVSRMDQLQRDWCWKDPRMTILLPFWREILTDRKLFFVFTFRNPLAIASSLYTRDNIPHIVSNALWEFKTRNVLNELKTDDNCVFTEYEELIKNPKRSCNQLITFLNQLHNNENGVMALHEMLNAIKPALQGSMPSTDFQLDPSQLELYNSLRLKNPIGNYVEIISRLQYNHEILTLYKKGSYYKERNLKSQLFISENGKSFSEKKSKSQRYNQGSSKVEFDISNFKDITSFRLDPLNDWASINFCKLELYSKGVLIGIITEFTSNSLITINENLFFATRDPQMIFNVDDFRKSDIDTVIFYLNYNLIGSECKNYFADNPGLFFGNLLNNDDIKAAPNDSFHSVFKRIQSTINSLNESITNNNITIDTKNKTLEQQQLELSSLVKDNKKLTRDIEEKLKITIDQTETILTLNYQNEEMSLELGLLKQEVTKKQVTINEQHETIDNLKIRIVEQQNNIGILKHEIDSVQVTISQQSETIEQLNNKLSAFHKSITFKIIKLAGLSMLIFRPALFISKIREIKTIIRFERIIKSSPLFDRNYYLNNNSDVAQTRISPAKHYLLHGGFEGRNPSEKFDTNFYKQQNTDVVEAGINPLLHYCMYGIKEGRKIKAVDQIPIEQEQPIEKPNKITEYSKKEENDQNLNIDSSDEEILHIIDQSGLFDTDYYLNKYPDIKRAGIDPLKHFIEYGWKEGRNPNALFDTKYYWESNCEVNKTGLNPIIHFINFGWKEGLNPHPLFNTKYYLKTNPDVEKSGINPLIHFIHFGENEGRKPHRFIDTNKYIDHKPAIKNELNNQVNKDLTDLNGKIVNSSQSNPVAFPNNTTSFSKKYLQNLNLGKTKRIAVLASFCSNGKIPDYVVYYLKGLQKVVDGIIFIADNPVFTKEIKKIESLVCYCSFERHEEYDFGSYKRGYIFAKENGVLNEIDELIFCNDSCYGPVIPFTEMFNIMSKENSDFWGITESKVFAHHIQSYFITFSKRVFLETSFEKFMLNIKKQDNVKDVILNYEVKLTEFFTKQGFSASAFIKTIFTNDVTRLNQHPHIEHFPNYLVQNQSPLIKTKAFKKSICNLDGIDNTLMLIRKNNPELYNIIIKDSKSIIIKKISNIAFSFIMPTYNRAHCICNAIDSVLIQNHNKFELIIVDDGSTDNTEELIHDKYKQEIKLHKIRYIKLYRNSGVCFSRNKGLEKAKNPWIAYIDTDNTIRPYFLKTFAGRIVENPNRKIFYAQLSRNEDGFVTGKDFNYETLLKGNYIDLGVFVHHISIYKKLGGFDTTLKRLVDWDLILTYAQKYKPIFIPIILLDYCNNMGDKNRISIKESVKIAHRYIIKKHMNLIQISTIITTYNHEKFVRKAIESAISQKGKFIHDIIISDDGSTDNTPKIIEEYAKRYPTLIQNISQKENVGISRNMKRCFSAANGEYIAILEGDDYWIDNYKLEKQKEFLAENNDCKMVFSKIKVHNLKEDTFRFLERQEKIMKEKLDGEDFIAHPSMNLIANFSCCLFSTSILKTLPLIIFDERINEIAIAFYFEQFGYIGYIDEVMSVYQQHPNGLWSGSDKKNQLTSGLKTRQMVKEVASIKYKDRIQQIINEKYETPLKEIANYKR
jgi:glycosyltransferase involved in cell wall biosynthesis